MCGPQHMKKYEKYEKYKNYEVKYGINHIKEYQHKNQHHFLCI